MSDRRVESSLRSAEDDQAEETDFGKGLARSEDKLDVGDVIAGKYRIEQVIGQGGMGVVVKARHLTLDEPVAIKVLRSSLMNTSGMVARFIREARAASKIKSHHVVRVTDVDTLPSGTPYMVMEYLEGVDLLALRRRKRGAFEIAEVVEYVVQACDAIAEAHAIGIVHRDLKPGNLFLATRRDGRSIIKVLDFGISKIDNSTEQDTTRTGQLMGSPKYMSPEQMLGLKTLDARADIWALGTILYEFFAGRPPFTAEHMPALCTKVLHTTPDPPRKYRPELPQELEDIVLRCLRKEPENRFAGVAELMQALMPFAPEQSVPSVTAPPISRTPLETTQSDPTVREGTPQSTSAPQPVTRELAQNPSEISQTTGPLQTPKGHATTVGWDTRQQVRKKRADIWIVGSIAAALVVASVVFFIVGRNRSPAIQPSAADASEPQSSAITAGNAAIEPASAAAAPPEASALVPPVVTSAAATPSAISSARAPAKAPASQRQTAPARNAKPVPFDPFGGSRN